LQDFNKSLSYAQPKGAYCSFLGTFENLNKPYSAEFGLPYVVLASTTAYSLLFKKYQEAYLIKIEEFKSKSSWYFLKSKACGFTA